MRPSMLGRLQHVIVYGTDSAWAHIRLAPSLMEALDAESLRYALEPAYWMLDRAASDAAIKLAPSGRLGRKIVQDGEERFRFTELDRIGHKPQNQDDVPPLPALRELLTRARLVRAYKGKLVVTKLGRATLARAGDTSADRQLLIDLAAQLCPDPEPNFTQELTMLVIVHLLDDETPKPVRYSKLMDTIGEIAGQRWKLERRGGGQFARWDVAWEFSDAVARLMALRALVERSRDGERTDGRFLQLVDPVGIAMAAHAMHARATLSTAR